MAKGDNTRKVKKMPIYRIEDVDRRRQGKVERLRAKSRAAAAPKKAIAAAQSRVKVKPIVEKSVKTITIRDVKDLDKIRQGKAERLRATSRNRRNYR